MNRLPLRRHHSSFGFYVWRGHPPAMRAPNTHPDLEINLVISGTLEYFIRGRFETVVPDVLTIFWAGMPHQLLNASSKAEAIWVTIPLPWFMQYPLPDPFKKQLLAGDLVRETNAESRLMDRPVFERWVRDYETTNREARDIVMLEIEARLRRLAMSLQPPAARKTVLRHTVSSDGAIERITHYVGEHYREPLSIDQIARAVRRHPNYLMNYFKRSCGMSLWDYVVGLRVSHAQRLLLTTDMKILDVALDSGFGSVSRFHRVFRRSCGQTPRQYRVRRHVSPMA